MNFIIDANIIISALLRDSKTRELMNIFPFTLYSPDTLLESIEKYKSELIEKSGLLKEEFETLLNFILKKIIIVRQERYRSKLEEAGEIMDSIDLGDVSYIALALSIENSAIWSDDKHFKKQDKIKIYTTKDILKYFNSF